MGSMSSAGFVTSSLSMTFSAQKLPGQPTKMGNAGSQWARLRLTSGTRDASGAFWVLRSQDSASFYLSARA